jgi:hypothetical protein
LAKEARRSLREVVCLTRDRFFMVAASSYGS